MPRITDPFEVKGLCLRNRLVMAPMVTGMAVADAPSDLQIAWYREHARAGVGLIIVESVPIAPDGLLLPFMMGNWDDAQVPGLARVAAAIQAEGVPAVLQIVHGGARAWRGESTQERIGASAEPLLPGPAPREMTEAEILGMVEAFAAAARRAKAAGFKGVEIHAAHYYLLSQFLSPYSNRRTDRWGGDREGRARFPVAVVKAVRAAVGEDFPIFCRMHSVELMEGGLELQDAVYTARALEAAGVDVLDGSGIGTSSIGEWQGRPFLNSSSVPARGAAPGGYAESAGVLRAALNIPVITVGKLSEPGAAQGVLDRGQADLVALARPLIADPQVARKLLDGRDDEIVRCQECLACFKAIRLGPVHCSINKEL